MIEEFCPYCNARSVGAMVVAGQLDYHCYSCKRYFLKPKKVEKIVELGPEVSETDDINKLVAQYLKATQIDELLELKRKVERIGSSEAKMLVKWINRNIEMLQGKK